VQNGLTNFKVLDVCCATTCTPTSNLPDRINSLRNVFAEDGVHFTPNGYNNLAKRTIGCLKTLLLEILRLQKNIPFSGEATAALTALWQTTPVAQLGVGLAGPFAATT
jgi:hypothetical protein